MLPDYESKHYRRQRGFDGPDLAKKRREEILARAPEVDAESIRKLGGDRYYVQSVTHSSRMYLVDLGKLSCDCPDWPRVQLCKHVAAVAHFFGNGHRQIVAALDDAPDTAQPIREGSVGQSNGSAAVILENVIAVSKAMLSDGAPSSPGTVRSLQMVESHLTAVVHSSRSSESPLPDQEEIPPNQGTWAETAKRMGVKRQRRRPRPAATSPPPPATELIGALNRKNKRLKITDPYSGGLSSGRNAAPDARTAAQNTEARTAANGSLSQPPKRGRDRAGISPLSTHTSYLAPPLVFSTPAYPVPTTHTPGTYAYAPYVYWPYGQYTSLPRYPPPQ